ncbi:O-antigen ligase family protein [Halomonas alkalisoli]|uniref:O-antigen ligase family protein n=1 Tax=Halomonas alkalisoli TaxID=2907158 RepID=UPI001F3C3D78|nr:O-antigen ligase family protein [Halomonas alkalisoli]MCE9681666.1 hypothetical protein [Halomonas alkalisoli]
MSTSIYQNNTPLCVFSVLCVILLSKSLYFESYGQNNLLIIYLFFLVLLVILRNFHLKIDLYLLLFACSLIVIPLINPDSAVSSILVLVVRVLIGILFVSLIPFQVFARYYIKIILILSVISWLTWPVIYFDVYSLVPDFTPIDERITRNYILFGVWDSFVLHQTFRNSGLWWEPGAFQVFVNLAFIFMLVTNTVSLKKYFLLLITIITINSTVGFIVFFLLSFVFLADKAKSSSVLIKLRYATILIITLIVCTILFIPVVLDKFTAVSNSFVSFQSRYFDFLISFNMFLDNPFIGYGFGTQVENAIPYGQQLLGQHKYNLVKPTGADGLTMFLAQVGFIGFIFLFYFIFPRYAYKKGLFSGLIFSLCLTLIFNTQNFTFTIIFIVLLFYGLVGYKKQNRFF